MAKSPEELEKEIRVLLERSNLLGSGPHGKTVTAVMKRVHLLCRRASQRVVVPAPLRLAKRA